MAEVPTSESTRAPDFKSQGEQIGLGLTEPAVITRFGKGLLAGIQAGVVWLVEFLLKNAGKFVVFLAKSIMTGEDRADPVFKDLTNAAIKDLTGADPTDGHAAVGKQLLHAMTGGSTVGAGGQLVPGTAGAEAFLEIVMKLALEGYLEGGIIGALSLNYFEKFTELDDILAEVLGIGRMSRRVFGPLMDARIITPMEWYVNRTYRHKLLGAGEVARQVARGRMTRDAGVEELARQGYSNERIEALLNAAAKFHSVPDVDLLVRSGQWSKADAIQHLRDQGYEPTVAETELTLEKLRRIATFERQLAAAAIDAFADGRITRSEMIGWLGGTTLDSQESAQLAELADARRALRVKPLTSGEARALVKAGILSAIDYRRALEREGRDADAVNALDLLLKHEIDEKRAIDELRDEQDRERAAEQAAREAERDKARQAAADARQLARRGREADLERAVIRGRIPIDRYVEVISLQFDADTVGIMVADVEDAREQFLADQAKREAAEQRAARKQLDVGAVRQAVLGGVLTLDEFRRHPAVAALDAGDVEILSRTLAAELRDREVALQRKEEAAAQSKARGIDLGRYAQLVRRGIRTLDDYRARVAEIFDAPADVDAVVELLEQDLAADAAERAARDAGETTTRAKGLSLEQLRRAVLAGDAPIADFETFLITQQFTIDAQRTLMAGLSRELAEVDAARARQEQTDSPVGALELPLSELSRAARLGIISPSEYRARLIERGFDELDAEISVDMLLREIATTQTARALRDQVEREPGGVGLTLAELARAVKAGIKSVDDYAAALYVAGKTPDAVETLRALLEDEVAERKAAESRRKRIAERLLKDGLDLDALESDMLAGGISLDEYSATLAGVGVQPAEIGILVGLLVAQLNAAPAQP